MSQSEFAAAIDKIVGDYNDRLKWVSFSKDHLTLHDEYHGAG